MSKLKRRVWETVIVHWRSQEREWEGLRVATFKGSNSPAISKFFAAIT
ncbi:MULTISPECIES: hypothetical protein [Aerosakkonema]